ncbi:NAD(P)/FAD-dependent oxidoreductase [Saccharopolyspora griseoalba]|uniref:NAD(P)/FAD-dependent oxidoreductase n=1 Tax=Saccharopolyspora griseoalba TaxID=1431848 RepID=A0ABW2LDQ7_9PSEU
MSEQPRSAIVVGAGMAGLSTAFFLQRHGVEVTVLDRRGVAAGASWGNAGWLTPCFAVPLPEPSMLRTGLSKLFSPNSPLSISPVPDPRLGRFLLRLAGNCTQRRWRVSMAALAALNREALNAYDDIGLAEPTRSTERFLIVFDDAEQRAHIVEELEEVRAAGQEVDYELLTGAGTRELEPVLTEQAGAGLRLFGQRYLNPGSYLAGLADAVRAQGGSIVEDAGVADLRDLGSGVAARTAAGVEHRADVAVLATGAWLSPLARRFGVRMPVQAGRGYSCSVSGDTLPGGPTYFPSRKAVCTPLGERVRVSGMMEFTGPDQPLDRRRMDAVVDSVRPMLRGVDLEERRDEWVGPRPCTTDGLPLIGPTTSPRVHVCGGHNMWGIALGPVSGRLLAESIVTGRARPELAPLHPLR